MDRRTLIKILSLGLAGGVTPAAAPAPHPDWYGSPERTAGVRDIADEVEAFLKTARGHSPEFPGGGSIPLPFATIPTNLYVRRPAFADAVALPACGRLCRLVRKKFGCTALADVMTELWARWRPTCYHEVEDYPTREECQAESRVGVPTAMPDRLSTSRYVIDVAELDAPRLATILCSPILLAEEMTQRTRNAMSLALSNSLLPDSPWEGQGWVSPVEVCVKMDAFMLEVFSSVVSGGVLYQPAALANPSQSDRFRQTIHDMLGRRRRDPSHWHALPACEARM